ncbi:hypothetical protein ACH35V_34165 [Actinomadura sp. 1N219]|uniref:hypothetical protein n=1 Tax=Actinomadura sp. 1N219 TaxID=3375152 RepID=UPI0037A3911B
MLVIKLAVVVGLVDETGLGATHTDATGWFNLVMTPLIWGVPVRCWSGPRRSIGAGRACGVWSSGRGRWVGA